MELNRRDLLAKCVALGVVSVSPGLSLSALAEAWRQADKKPRPATPAVEFGPFYKRDAPHIATLRAPSDPGMPLTVSGAVFNTRGEALPGAKIEVWQTDHLGHYDLHGYRYRATLLAESSGKYGFSSVIPGHYPARICQHIHFAVTAPGHKPLVTQMYFATDPVFEGDPDKNFSKDPLCTARELVRPITLAGDPQTIIATSNFELVLEAL
jgi:protocatechuate 3,4-dioxygenase beta subunit